MISNPARRGGKLVTNGLSYGTPIDEKIIVKWILKEYEGVHRIH
jgi:hypothetical protein